MNEKVPTGLALFKSLLLHSILIGGMLVSATLTLPTLFEFEETENIELEQAPEEAYEIIEAVTVESDKVKQQIERIQQEREQVRKLEEQRVAELERRAREAQQRRERELKEAKQAEAQRQKEALEAQKEAERLERIKQENEKRIQAQKEEEARIEKQRQERIAEEKRRLEAERRQAELEKKMREEAEQQRQAREKAKRAQVQSEVDRFKALIQQTIQRNWYTDDSMSGKSCSIRISIARDGFVTNVQVGEGDRAVCESARAAVLKAGTLPVSDDPDVYKELSNFTLRVMPNKS